MHMVLEVTGQAGAAEQPTVEVRRPARRAALSPVKAAHTNAPATRPAAAAPRMFPFSAIVGQDDMKLALLIAAVEPAIGGVLVLGDRGTGKSTAVRALAAVLPSIEAVAGCPCNCDPTGAGRRCEACDARVRSGAAEAARVPVPVVDLPLGASEDRIAGALDIERALTRGEKAFEHGLLARANRGFLYIDEVNLLEDHLVDLLLDVAASGENLVERDGLSLRHPSRFVLVGSGNPEEGELRPQLLDRFGLSVDVTSPQDIETRIEIVMRRDAFERDPAGFAAQWREQEDVLRKQVLHARDVLGNVAADRAVLEAATRLCMTLGTDGLRGELTMLRAARALAALEGARATTVSHLRRVAPFAVRHRLRRNPLDEAGSAARIERAVAEVFGP
jgi:magnesium chelatase subunit I